MLIVIEIMYRDSVFPYVREMSGKVVSIYVLLRDRPGMLSGLIAELYRNGVNILTINQNIPVKGKAFVSVSARSENMNIEIGELLKRLFEVQGVIKIDSIVG